VQGAAAALAPNALLLVYGAKDEGAGSAAPLLEEVFDDVRTFATGGHCRVLIATTPRTGQPRRASLDSWRRESLLDFPGGSATWVSYPGVFAGGRLDSGTAMLLRNLPALRHGTRVLDFGCGSGVIGAAAGASGGNLRVDCLDVDAVALEAARENVPHARLILADGLSGIGDVRYHAILSNPPYHRGKAETLDAVDALIAGAGRVLVPGGHLVFVVQRRLPVEPLLEAAFPHVRALDGDGTFGVWDASTSPPRRRRPRS
jgi:16S rRNA (guanine1207-N2)-methyltransferase